MIFIQSILSLATLRLRLHGPMPTWLIILILAIFGIRIYMYFNKKK
jgi:hypothetical protein